MGDWAAALAGGLSGGAQAEGQIADDQIRQNDQAAAELRAANLQLDIKQRLAAADQMMKARAMEKFRGLPGGDVAPTAPVAAGAPMVSPMAAPPDQPTGTPSAAASGDSASAPAAAASQPDTSSGKSWASAVRGKLRYASLNAPDVYAVAESMLKPMLEDQDKQDAAEQKAAHDGGSLAVEQSKAAEDARHHKAEEGIEATKAAKDSSGSGQSPADAKMIEYLVAHGMERQAAVDRVMGTGAGATKDPVGLAASMASSLIAGGQVRVSKDDPPGTTLASKAMGMALDQIDAAQSRFRGLPALPRNPAGPGAPTGSTVPNPTGQQRPPLSSFAR